MDDRDRGEVLAGLGESTARLVDALRSTDGDPTRPSLLPDWTLAHVLTHLARNADSFTRVLGPAARGELVERYPGGRDGRNSDIGAGVGRSWDELVDDVTVSAERLGETFASFERWDGFGIEPDGVERRVDRYPMLRWREVEVHWSDLGIGHRFEDWPAGYIRRDLRLMSMLGASRLHMGGSLPDAALALAPHDRLAWLMGRLDVDGLAPAGVF